MKNVTRPKKVIVDTGGEQLTQVLYRVALKAEPSYKVVYGHIYNDNERYFESRKDAIEFYNKCPKNTTKEQFQDLLQ